MIDRLFDELFCFPKDFFLSMLAKKGLLCFIMVWKFLVAMFWMKGYLERASEKDWGIRHSLWIEEMACRPLIDSSSPYSSSMSSS
jgi:hypothetical protein